jgi:hypothetical protein
MRAYTPDEQIKMREKAKAFFDFLEHTESELPVNNPINPAVLVRDTLVWATCCIPQSLENSTNMVTGKFVLENMSQVLNTLPLENFFKECKGDRKSAIRKAIELMVRFVFQADWTPILNQADNCSQKDAG